MHYNRNMSEDIQFVDHQKFINSPTQFPEVTKVAQKEVERSQIPVIPSLNNIQERWRTIVKEKTQVTGDRDKRFVAREAIGSMSNLIDAVRAVQDSGLGEISVDTSGIDPRFDIGKKAVEIVPTWVEPEIQGDKSFGTVMFEEFGAYIIGDHGERVSLASMTQDEAYELAVETQKKRSGNNTYSQDYILNDMDPKGSQFFGAMNDRSTTVNLYVPTENPDIFIVLEKPSHLRELPSILLLRRPVDVVNDVSSPNENSTS
jgi:hypothetical protein